MPCPAGSFSLDGYSNTEYPCKQCPNAFYSSSPASTECTKCGDGQSTLGPGGSSADACYDSAQFCGGGICNGHGSCVVQKSVVQCRCEDGNIRIQRIHNTAWLTSAPLGKSCFSLNFVMLLQKANQNTLPPKILGTKQK